MINLTFKSFNGNLPYFIIGSIAAILFTVVAHIWSSRSNLTQYPLLGGEQYRNTTKRKEAYLSCVALLFDEGYKKFKRQIYRITTPDGDHLIVPNCHLDELGKRSDAEIDVQEAFEKTFENKHVRLFPSRDKSSIVNNVVKSDLNRNLARINPRLWEEVISAVSTEISPCEDAWTPVVISGALVRIIAIASGSIFLGPDLCRQEEYMDCAVKFTMDLVMASAVLKRIPSWLRSVAAEYLVPQVTRVRGHRRRMKRFLEPVIKARRESMAHGKGEGERPDDLFQWMLEKAAERGIADAGDLTDMTLLLLLAAIHTTSLAVTNIFYDLAIRPEVVENLRAEIKAVLSDSGGIMTTQALYDMKLVDSVMRESQRLNPPFLDTFRRYTLTDITLQNGDRIPAWTHIEAANAAVLLDPELYPDPETFNPHRFFHLRTDTNTPDPLNYKNREQYQFASVTKENMSFGFGRHACPGRYFAGNEIKMIVAQLLLKYDIKMPDGENSRYASLASGVVSAPDPTKVLLFRRRGGGS